MLVWVIRITRSLSRERPAVDDLVDAPLDVLPWFVPCGTDPLGLAAPIDPAPPTDAAPPAAPAPSDGDGRPLPATGGGAAASALALALAATTLSWRGDRRRRT